jgi:hypothetical protein
MDDEVGGVTLLWMIMMIMSWWGVGSVNLVFVINNDSHGLNMDTTPTDIY